MEIFISVLAVILAASCLIALVVSDTRDQWISARSGNVAGKDG